MSVVCEGQQVFDWVDYEISSSLIVPSSSFSMTRPFTADAWRILRRDARIRVAIDGTIVLDGFIDDRGKRSKANEMVIGGRDRAGRLVQESAPKVNYNGLEMTEGIQRLADPWVKKVTLSDARNRRLRLGKGFKMAVGNEPVTVRKIVARGHANPGQSRWSVIEEIVSNAGLMAWVSADGTEIFVGHPNQDQPAQFFLTNARVGGGSKSTVMDLHYDESNGDRYSLIAVVGNGGGTEEDFGESVSTRRSSVTDGPAADGTGRDFLYPKRLLMPESHYDSNEEASTVARRERNRRDFRRVHLSVDMPYHGQWFLPTTPTIFAPGTIARVVDEEMDPVIDDDFFIYSCAYLGDRQSGETTHLELVPKGTEIVL